MKISFNIRIFFLIFIPYVTLTAILLLTIRAYSQKNIIDIIHKEMQAKAELIGTLFFTLKENQFKESIEYLKKRHNLNYRITIIDKNGNIIFDSEEMSTTRENIADRDEFKEALKGSAGYTKSYREVIKSEMSYLAIPLTQNNIIVGAIRISMPLREFSDRINQLSNPILLYGIISVLLFYIITFIITSKMLKPIDDMIQVAERIQRGDFSARLLLPPSKEYELLYDTINKMLGEIQKLLTQNQQRTDELNSIISSINEGIVLVDKDFNIVLANKKFLEISKFQDETIVNKKLFEIIKNSDLNNIIKKTFENQSSFSDETEINLEYYLISSSYNKANDIVVVLLYNITYLKKAQIYKKEFVSNASHELKTPLTAINGFIETLLDEVKDDTHKRYLEVIKNHTQRMINIVNDLLSLSSLESGIPFIFSECKINEIISEVIPLFKKRIAEKNLLLELNLESNSPITCDRLKIEQAIINMIDNAVKYTDAGRILIKTYEDTNNVFISIEDSGIGIPAKDVERIFERFYVVNKSRSRALGGTGLGLSIVKHIINRHNGSINVESEEGKGSRFTIRLPKNLTHS
ncbi:MAG: cell wall metabolism sensor histidine kinase WalK [Deltaproteobacteria bacterium]|nr:cell wall metabolism sensor histidine kinase WalK [Deltaproteobacteria bacterium]